MRQKLVVAACGTIWGIQWRDKQGGIEGGRFDIHLGSPHQITTDFTFADRAQYEAIKRYLETIGLVKLSDRHLRPKN